MEFREDWLAPVMQVPYVPTLGAVHPRAASAATFNAVVSVAGTGKFLDCDKDVRWFETKDEEIFAGQVIHEPGLTVVPINRHKMAKHLILDIGEDHLTFRRDETAICAEAALDGIYVIRTPLPADRLDALGTVTAYKYLSRVERDFRSIKADDLDLRPVHHWLGDRVRAHVLICMLAAYLTWHLRKALAPLTYTDEQPPAPASPVAPARRSARAAAKAAAHASADGQILHSFRGLIGHLATLTRTTVTIGGATFDKISEPTPVQRRAFDLIKAPIPLTLTMT